MISPIPQTLAVAGGKGGIGKSTWAAELAATAAREHGWRVLLVETDPQGNLWRQLRVAQSDGQAMLDALIDGKPLPRQEARENLDVSLCGEAMFDFIITTIENRIRGALDPRNAQFQTAADCWSQSLGAVAGEYDLIVFDTPPGDKYLVESVLANCAAVVAVTTAHDEAAIDGLEIVYRRIQGSQNPTLKLLGVGLFAVSKQHKDVAVLARLSLETMLNGDAPVFENEIRMNLNVAHDHRARGLLAAELEQEAKAARKRLFTRLRQKKKDPDIDLRDSAAPRSSARVAADLAAEHYNLANEVLQALVAAQATQGSQR
jgi:chromosome partitioning protein